MTHVVTEDCILCKYTDCVEICPVDCFKEGVNFLVIDPEECIDCGLCIPECPIGAIYYEDELPDNFLIYKKINQEKSLIWPSIIHNKDALPNADDWSGKTGKLEHLEG